MDIMFRYAVLIIFQCILCTNLVKCQATSGYLNGYYYYCLDTSVVCPTRQIWTIDPRIVTPGVPPCPPGTAPCYGVPGNCGTRLIPQTQPTSENATQGEFPWQAYITKANVFAGSGALVHEYYVITAAHKVYLSNASDLTVAMGVWNPSVSVNVQTSKVANKFIPNNFNISTLVNDIAVLKLVQPIVLGIYTTINKICLPAAGSGASYIGKTCTVSGWGQRSFENPYAPVFPPKKVNVLITNYTTCRASFARPNLLGPYVDTYLDPNGEICAGGEDKKDACTQDGGSPLSCPEANGAYSVAGLVIWGKNCGQPGVYGVYVSVPNYLSFIMENIKNPV